MPVGIGNRKSALSEINITPLVDVMLVILIIFMVVAPTIQHGVEVEVPEATLSPIESKEEQIVVSVTKSGDIYINKSSVKLEDLQVKLANIFKRGAKKELFLKADKEVPYGTVMETMALIRKAGISKIGMVTEPEEE